MIKHHNTFNRRFLWWYRLLSGRKYTYPYQKNNRYRKDMCEPKYENGMRMDTSVDCRWLNLLDKWLMRRWYEKMARDIYRIRLERAIINTFLKEQELREKNAKL